MAAAEVLIVKTGTANLASIKAGLARAGASARMAESPAEIKHAAFVMVPGVGSFGAAMAELREQGTVEALRQRFAEGRATMAICVGLQVLCHSSEENPGVEGLSVVSTEARRFRGAAIRVPQMGWNKVSVAGHSGLLEDGYGYFANSYRLEELPDGWSGAFSHHGGRFLAAMEKGDLLACQFHPELSGDWGLKLMKRWLNRG
jgi:imidazole glycerol-phosphate synthase subunit HisH